MHVDIKMALGGAFDDQSVDRTAAWQVGEADSREDLHKLVDEMWDTIEQTALASR